MKVKVMSDYQRCQIDTPHEIIKGYWELLKSYRSSFGRIIDMGAGDGRFSYYGNYRKYDGIEIDAEWKEYTSLPDNAKIHYGCAFDFKGTRYDACIGNPPYVRHHEIDDTWRKKTLLQISNKLSITLSEQSNLFAYFMCLGIIKTKSDGLIALIIPYEWVSRPSIKALQDYIKEKKWGVHVYRFSEDIFDGVLTTASITIINKAEIGSEWEFYNIDREFNIKTRKGITGSRKKILHHENRGDIWALRGLSPGTQKVFTLTEGERIHFSLSMDDVVPCITSLRELPRNTSILDSSSFSKYFVRKGLKCWLIRSDLPWSKMSKQLRNYLSHVPEDLINTATCNERTHWYQYKSHPTSKILYSSGFTEYGPKFLINRIKAIAIGSVHGIHYEKRCNRIELLTYLRNINFERGVVPHSGSLKKVEVKQMNGILNKFKVNA